MSFFFQFWLISCLCWSMSIAFPSIGTVDFHIFASHLLPYVPLCYSFEMLPSFWKNKFKTNKLLLLPLLLPLLVAKDVPDWLLAEDKFEFRRSVVLFVCDRNTRAQNLREKKHQTEWPFHFNVRVMILIDFFWNFKFVVLFFLLSELVLNPLKHLQQKQSNCFCFVLFYFLNSCLW